jgi:hyperosmotically inducible periplasmic protein
MRARSRFLALASLVAFCVMVIAAPTPARAGRTIGQFIDDASIATQVTAKLAADRLSNLTKITAKSENGVVTLSGTVDSPERRAKAAQIAAEVSGVKGIVNNIQVSGTGASASTPSPPATPTPSTAGAPSAAASTMEATGTVASVDPAAGTITLQDGRVLRTTDQTVVWQPSAMGSLKPGSQVLVRGASPAGFQSSARDWRMGTVSRIDRGANQIVFTDGTTVRVAPGTDIHRGTERLSLDRLEPGWEVAVRMPGASASPAPAVDASEVSVLWAPPVASR